MRGQSAGRTGGFWKAARKRSSRRALLGGFAGLAISAVAACGGATGDDALALGAGTDSPAAQAPAVVSEESDDLVVFLIATDAEVGENRLPFALLTGDGERILDQADRIKLTYRLLSEADGSPAGPEIAASDPIFRSWPVSGGIYTSSTVFESAGTYEFSIEFLGGADGEMPGSSGTTRLIVRDESASPGVGDRIPPTPSKIASSPDGLRLITSDLNPRPQFYRLSVDDAVASGKPTVVNFGTPAWCQTATCGPQLDVLEMLEAEFSGQVHFIHVEIFDNPAEMEGDPSRGVTSPIIESWNFVSEPWTYVIDGESRVAARFEAFTTVDELRDTIVSVLERSDS